MPGNVWHAILFLGLLWPPRASQMGAVRFVPCVRMFRSQLLVRVRKHTQALTPLSGPQSQSQLELLSLCSAVLQADLCAANFINFSSLGFLQRRLVCILSWPLEHNKCSWAFLVIRCAGDDAGMAMSMQAMPLLLTWWSSGPGTWRASK